MLYHSVSWIYSNNLFWEASFIDNQLGSNSLLYCAHEKIPVTLSKPRAVDLPWCSISIFVFVYNNNNTISSTRNSENLHRSWHFCKRIHTSQQNHTDLLNLSLALSGKKQVWADRSENWNSFTKFKRNSAESNLGSSRFLQGMFTFSGRLWSWCSKIDLSMVDHCKKSLKQGLSMADCCTQKKLIRLERLWLLRDR